MPTSNPRLLACARSNVLPRLLLFAVLLASPAINRSLGAETIDFARDIRPILSENCSYCHGPDEQKREADLRLDTSEGAWSVIEKGDSEQSELMRRLVSEDHDELMPPADSNRSLSDHQIELIRQWINQGAPWEQHWSFRPLAAPEIPQPPPNPQAPIRNPIDAFVQQALIDADLTPAPEASRETLIRRVSLDLTGLPPTPQQVDAFVQDQEPDAYERLVNRLLDSPHYGERMAWDWLDAARYADTNGYQGDNERTMWPWRDWVVDAFNRNLPFDQFTVWQLAGDLLPAPTLEQQLATGFCRNHMINGEGGRIAEENRVEYVMDMTETMGTVWLGMTLNCCRCHDHKYDPISKTEYYQLFAFFNQTPVNGGGGNPQTPPVLPAPTDEQTRESQQLESKLAELDSSIETLTQSLAEQQPAWESQQQQELSLAPRWQTLHAETASAVGTQLQQLDDHSLLATGTAPEKDTYTVTAAVPAEPITAIRLEALRHESLNGNSLSHADSGNFVLTEFEVAIVDAESDEQAATPVKLAGGEATFEQGNHAIAAALDGNPATGWAVYEGKRVDREHAALFRLENPVELRPDQRLKIVLRHDSQHVKHNLGRFRLSVTSSSSPQLSSDSDALLAALETPADQRTDAQRDQLRKAHRESVPEYRSLQGQRDSLAKQLDQLRSSFPKVMVMADMSERRKTHVLSRGLYNKPTDEVEAALPEFLPRSQPSEASVETPAPNRLDLARWLVDPANPLTPRVTVNRFWQQIFGIGLVKTTEDFGAQGEIPVHIDLLNWLSWKFQQDGWDVKNLMRLIVTSHTYRQSSKVIGQEDYERDPENRLLARGARYRMPAWMLRDQALFVSGLLSDHRGGPAINTYQPPGVWEEASFGNKTYRLDSGEKLYRRSLYVFWRRIIAPTMFFDNASRQTCTVKATRTNTPLHALQTLNGTAYVEAARNLAQQILQHAADDSQDGTEGQDLDAVRIDQITRRILARPADDRERAILLRGLQRSRSEFSAAPDNASSLLAVGQSPRDESLNPTEHAAWTSLCLAVLNLDETLNRE